MRRQLRPLPESLSTLDPTDGIALFTDGSSSVKDRSGGWAWLAIDLGDGQAWDSGAASDTTNNQMEMQAWVEGLIALHEAFGAREILVFSDSEYVGLGAMNRQRKRNKNRDLWSLVDDAVDLHDYVEFVHVKGHSGHLYNDRVDQLASDARHHGLQAA